MTAHTGWSFGKTDLIEEGDYLLLGTGNTATVTGQIRVFDIADPLNQATDSIVSAPLTLSGFPTKNWVANASVDISSWTTANTVNVTIENILVTSTSLPVSLAFLEKKFVALNVITSPVPEAETYSMMLAGLGLVGFMVARRRQRV